MMGVEKWTTATRCDSWGGGLLPSPPKLPPVTLGPGQEPVCQPVGATNN